MGERDTINHYPDKQTLQHISYYMYRYSFASANSIRAREKLTFYQKLLNFIKNYDSRRKSIRVF